MSNHRNFSPFEASPLQAIAGAKHPSKIPGASEESRRGIPRNSSTRCNEIEPNRVRAWLDREPVLTSSPRVKDQCRAETGNARS
jgi:hypothetical protein